MIDVVIIFNGLGNQMSQYAFYLAKSAKHRSVYYFSLAKSHFFPHNGFELSKVFNIPEQCPMPPLCKTAIKNKYPPKSIVPSKFGTFLRKFLMIKTIWENNYCSFDPSMISSRRNCFINCYFGGWHSSLYHKEIIEKVFDIFKFNLSKLNETSIGMLKLIESNESISIHIRRGDYLCGGDGLYEGICTDAYYDNAINFITAYVVKKLKTPKFFIFSDDITYIESHFSGMEYTIVHNVGEDSWMDMCLMSHCKHNIIANSTFSWWAAYLNKNPEKIVICPFTYMNSIDTPEFYPKEWTRMPSYPIQQGERKDTIM